jgi:hypothetical protein
VDEQGGGVMLFKPELLAKVLSGEKTQTRRMVKPGDVALNGFRNPMTPGYWIGVVTHNGRTKWQVFNTYAVCPGRGKVQQGRIFVRSIRQECAADITEADARAEGFANRDEFLAAWDAINGKGNRDASVWVLTFEVAE